MVQFDPMSFIMNPEQPIEGSFLVGKAIGTPTSAMLDGRTRSRSSENFKDRKPEQSDQEFQMRVSITPTTGLSC